MNLAIQEGPFGEKIFEVILYFASEEGVKPLPNNEAGLLLPLAGAVVECLGGDVKKIPSPHDLAIDDFWLNRVNKEVELVIQNNPKNFSIELIAALTGMLRVEWKHDYGESWWESSIRGYLAFGEISRTRTFYLTHAKVMEIKELLQGNIAPNVAEHCKQIGLLMRKRIIENSAA